MLGIWVLHIELNNGWRFLSKKWKWVWIFQMVSDFSDSRHFCCRDDCLCCLRGKTLPMLQCTYVLAKCSSGKSGSTLEDSLRLGKLKHFRNLSWDLLWSKEFDELWFVQIPKSFFHLSIKKKDEHHLQHRLPFLLFDLVGKGFLTHSSEELTGCCWKKQPILCESFSAALNSYH